MRSRLKLFGDLDRLNRRCLVFLLKKVQHKMSTVSWDVKRGKTLQDIPRGNVYLMLLPTPKQIK